MNKAAAKTKVLTGEDDPKHLNKFKVKFTVVVKSKESKTSDKEEKPQPKFVVEHCQGRFLNPQDRDNFIEVYNEMAGLKE